MNVNKLGRYLEDQHFPTFSTSSVEDNIAHEDAPSSGPVDTKLVSRKVEIGHFIPGGSGPDLAGVLDEGSNRFIGVEVSTGCVSVVGVCHE